MKAVSKTLSYLFHPIVLTTYVFWVIMFYYPYLTIENELFKWATLGTVFFMTAVIPSVAIVGMKQMNIISEFKMDNVKERRVPYLVTTVIYAMASYWFYQHSQFNIIVWKVLAIVTLSMFIVTVISFFWKISAHSLGVGGLVGLTYWIHYSTIQDNLWLVSASFLLAGAVMSARLYLKAHDGWQVLAGFSAGVLLSVFSYPALQ